MEIFLSCLRAFAVGAGFCIVAQILIDLSAWTPARILVLYVTGGVFLGAVGIYEPLHRFAGCGASVPLVGFGALIAKGTREAVKEKGLIGILSGGLEASAASIAAAMLFALLVALFFKSKPKRL